MWHQWQRTHLLIQETQETWVKSLGGEDPLEEEWQPTPVFLPGKIHGQQATVPKVTKSRIRLSN